MCADITVCLNRKHRAPMLLRRVAVYAFISASIIPLLFMMTWMSQINLDREHEDTVRNSYLESSPGAAFPVLGFGDAETEECLPVVGLPQALCFDVVLSIDYELVSQPGIHRSKQFRFVGAYHNRIFEWRSKSLKYPASKCEAPISLPTFHAARLTY